MVIIDFDIRANSDSANTKNTTAIFSTIGAIIGNRTRLNIQVANSLNSTNPRTGIIPDGYCCASFNFT